MGHLLQRQIVEVRVRNEREARAVQERISAVCRDQVPTLLERCCDALASGADRLQIDRVEVDLGVLSGDHLDEDFIRALTEALPARLTHAAMEHARDASPAKAVDRRLELLLCVLRTGRLPWSEKVVAIPGQVAAHEAKAGRGPVAEALTSLLSRPVAAWLDPLRAVLAEPGARARLVFELPDALLLRLAEALGIMPSASLAALMEDLPASASGLMAWQSLSFSKQRLAMWLAVFSEGQPSSAEPPVSAARIFCAFARSLDPANPAHPALAQALEAAARLRPAWILQGRAVRVSVWRSVLEFLHVPAPLPESTGRALARKDSALRASAEEAASLTSAPAWIEALAAASGMSVTECCRLVGAALPVAPVPSVAMEPRHSAMREEETLPATHAGLVLLWPFLPNFFHGLELLAPSRKGFASEDHAMRAVLLLNHLAAGESPASAVLLPFHQILCGLEPGVPMPLDLEITPAESDACEALLAAVISHHPMWRSLTPATFRQAWLQRAGLLRSSHGAWQLHVERQGQDIIVDRLPWPLEVVRLPWMAGALLVEWQNAVRVVNPE